MKDLPVPAEPVKKKYGFFECSFVPQLFVSKFNILY